MNPQRIADLLTPFFAGDKSSSLSSRQLEQISMYIDLLLRWNARINLTAIRTPEEIVARHFGESLFAARHLPLIGIRDPADPSVSSPDCASFAPFAGAKLGHTTSPTEVSTPCRLIDVGSGAGFPGLPIKIWSPPTPVTLIESNQKKVAFLREVIRTLTLTGINVFPSRVEGHPPASASIVTLRAVERFDKILPVAARLLTDHGTLALLIGKSQVSQAQHSLPALSWSKVVPIPLSSDRIVALGSQLLKSSQGRNQDSKKWEDTSKIRQPRQ
jgi:16S rRNA (guanine527-N7)-methyltransferase